MDRPSTVVCGGLPLGRLACRGSRSMRSVSSDAAHAAMCIDCRRAFLFFLRFRLYFIPFRHLLSSPFPYLLSFSPLSPFSSPSLTLGVSHFDFKCTLSPTVKSSKATTAGCQPRGDAPHGTLRCGLHADIQGDLTMADSALIHKPLPTTRWRFPNLPRNTTHAVSKHADGRIYNSTIQTQFNPHRPKEKPSAL